jgi:hypothetical protein
MGRRVPRYVKQLKRLLKAGKLLAVQPGMVSLVDVAHDDDCRIWTTQRCTCRPDLTVRWTTPPPN